MPLRSLTNSIATATWRLAGCASLALLVACQSGTPDEPYANYLDRLGRTLSVAVPAITFSPIPRLPRPAQLRLDISSGSLDALDFLAISGCAVQVTIGKRNSSLGRMARASQQLLLELEFLLLAPECIAWQRKQGEAALADTLQAAWQTKRQQLPRLVFNATLGGEEYRALWRIPVNPGDYPAGTSSRVLTALTAINGQVQRWLEGDYRADNLQFEILLSEVATGDGGALLQALSRQGDWLEAADSMIATRMQKGPLCRPGIRPQSADILRNVVRKYFIGDIQPRAAALGSRQYELLPAVRALEDMLTDTLPTHYESWRVARHARLTELVAAPQRHVEQLITIQRPCEVQ